MRVLVTGASGFIGRRLCRQLRADGSHVIGLDLVPAISDCDQSLVGDLTVAGDWTRAMDGVDTVFHLAGKVHALSEVKQDDTEYFRINTEGTRNLLRAAQFAQVRRFVFFSTIKAMSREGNPILAEAMTAGRAQSEDDEADPDTPYGRSKREAERLVLSGEYVPEPVVLRLCMVYGAGAKGNIQKMLDAVSHHRFPPLPEVGNRRSMVHVADVVRAALLAGTHPMASGQRFIVSDGKSYSTREMYDLMCRALRQRPPRWSVPLWCLAALGYLGDTVGRVRGRRFLFDSDALEKLVGSAWYSSKRIEERLGFRAEWNLERALPEMVEELRGCGEHRNANSDGVVAAPG